MAVIIIGGGLSIILAAWRVLLADPEGAAAGPPPVPPWDRPAELRGPRER